MHNVDARNLKVRGTAGPMPQNLLLTLSLRSESAGEQGEKSIPLWIDDHELISCINYLPRGTDTSRAVTHVHRDADPDTRTRIDVLLAHCREKSGLMPVCRLCVLDFWDFREAVQADALARHGVSDERTRMVSTAILFCIYVLSTR